MTTGAKKNGNKNGYGSIPHVEDLEVDKEDGSADNQKRNQGGFRNNRVIFPAIAISLLLVIAVCIFTRRRNVITTTNSTKTPVFYKEQLVDHHDPSAGMYSQKYFEYLEHFKGPGSPIFVILGGEDPMIDLLYPYIYETLGEKYGAYTMGPEHRFFGDSWPVPYEKQTNADLRNLLTPEQSLLDIVRLIQHKQKQLGCGPRGTPTYCPVMAVGGSYPGLLVTLLRLRHSDVVDIAYAGSAPLYLYSHGVDSNAYYDKVTQVADVASPGCSDAVRSALLDVQDYIHNSGHDIDTIASNVGICKGTVPKYVDNNKLLSEELMMVILTHMADTNMAFYPPTRPTFLSKSCDVFQDMDSTPNEKVHNFLAMSEGGYENNCFDMMSEVPPGPHGHISASDWSGVGSEPAGWMWDFLSCVLIPECGTSSASMFPERPWTLEWFTNHCERRFGYTPRKQALNDQFHFTELTNVTHLLFTNGINDGWSVASVMIPPTDSSIEVINFPNGAHHSDLRVAGMQDYDTPDIKAGHARITELVGTWLEEIRGTSTA